MSTSAGAASEQWPDKRSMSNIRYRAIVYESFPLGFDTFVVYIPEADERYTFPSTVKQILDTCRTTDTFEGLASRSAALLNISNEQRGWVRGVISELVSCGLIVPETSLFQKCGRLSPGVRPIASLYVPTADRALQIQRTLLSYAQNLDSHGKTPALLVLDDSKSDRRSDYLRAIHDLRLRQSVRYSGTLEKESYIQELSREGIDPEIGRFALLGDFPGLLCTPGANRNCILLDAVGERVITVDDDTLCQLTIHPERGEDLRLSAKEDPRDGWFYENRNHLLSETSWSSQDLLGEHDSMLGRTLADLVAEEENPVTVDGPGDHLIRGLRQGSGRVVATMSGIVGDSGTYTSCSLLRSTGAKQRRLCASEAAFKRALASRESLAVVRGRTITQHPFCIATTLGLDNTDLLPPFFPVGRNEDGVFGALIRLATPHFLGHIPLAVFHDAHPGRTYERFPQFRISDMVLCLLAFACQEFRGETQSVLRSLGRNLLDIARLGDAEFWNVLFTAATSRKAKQIRITESVMKSMQECPAYWKTEVSAFHQHTLSILADPDCYVPVELKDVQASIPARGATKKLIAMTGSLLCAWPDIIDAAWHLRNRGIRISKELGYTG